MCARQPLVLRRLRDSVLAAPQAMRTRSQTARKAACSANSTRTTLGDLPDEVLVLVFSELATPRCTDAGFRERQRTLLPLWLVDRRWRRLAQPRLAEQIRFTSPLVRDCSLASAALPRIGASVRYLGYVVNQTPAPAAVSLRDVLKHLPRLVEVRVDSDELDWHALRELAKLPRECTGSRPHGAAHADSDLCRTRYRLSRRSAQRAQH